MLQLTETDIRAAFINASLSERKAVTLPSNVATLAGAKLDYLGWRDPKIPGLGYVIAQLDEGPVGLLLCERKGKMVTRPQCSWCIDVQLPNDVAFFSTKRAGQAGRNGDTIGILACSNFECSSNVRKLPSVAYIGFDVEAARQKRIGALGEHLRSFLRDVRDGS
ncbi:FBP domain-containing protein [Cryobacterium sp. TMS1-13-1]|uniref:FBP domain-containing protein n=1 Tax=Cryobacterium sp. TMS1-13-1 TaxID=1259220 RepID=UPI00106D8960|nr:FBP domain-containing protein [Cryobacterium sp. TMS1-13-1]TFD23361.1 FBP domain-containing protein [Cryobacterium sp. TMS1-13-1]